MATRPPSRPLVARVGAVAAGAAMAAWVGTTAWRVYQVMGSPSARVGFELDEEELDRAFRFLASHPAVDAHAHPGRTFVRDAEHLTPGLRLYTRRRAFEARTIGHLRAGSVAAACFCAVADLPTLDARGGGLRSVRSFAAGEAYAVYRTQLANLRALADSGAVTLVLDPSEVRAPDGGPPGAILGVEGGDFLEDDLGRVEAAFAEGVRVLTLVHFHRGGLIGDVMTEEPVHGGLTRFGREVVGELNRVGMLVDVAHCSERTAYDVLEVATRPVVVSHSDVEDGHQRTSRFVSLDLAREVAGAGGVVGAWPAGYVQRTLADYVTRILRLVDLLGEDHVCLGTDMDANYRPVFETYAKMPLLVGGLLRWGMPEEVLAKVVGGNFLTVWGAALRDRG